MARTHAKILTSIWSDNDFLATPPLAQRMFFVLISQPKLSIAGVIDYLPGRWARTSTKHNTVKDAETQIAELEQRRFVIVDRDSSELLIRSFVRNDGVCQRWQMIKAMWSAWEAVTSLALRERIVAELPDEAWTNDKAIPPPTAVAIRRQHRWQPDCQSESHPECDPEHLHLHLQPASAAVGSPIAIARAALAGSPTDTPPTDTDSTTTTEDYER